MPKETKKKKQKIRAEKQKKEIKARVESSSKTLPDSGEGEWIEDDPWELLDKERYKREKLEEREKNRQVGHRIRKMREKHKIGQIELAQDAGLSQGYLSRIEQCQVMPSKDSLKGIVDSFYRRDGKTNIANLVQGTTIEAVLDVPTFMESHKFCPNSECPETIYMFRAVHIIPSGNHPHLEVDRSVADLALYIPDLPESIREEHRQMNERYLPLSDGEMTQVFGGNIKGSGPIPDFTDDWPDFGSSTGSYSLLWREFMLAGVTSLAEVREKYQDLTIQYRWVIADHGTHFCEHCGTKLSNTCFACDVLLKLQNQQFCHGCGCQLNAPLERKGGQKNG